MTDVTADYLALRRDVAAKHCTTEVIRAFGPESATFLQGQLSADVASPGPGEWAWSLLLEPQGKLVGWVRVWGRPGDDEVLMDVGGGAGQVVRIASTASGCGSAPSWSREPGVRLDAWAERPAPADIEVRSELRATVDWPGVGGVDLLGPAVKVPEGIHESGPEAFDSVRIECGWPAMGAEFPASGDPSVIPAEAGAWLVDASASFTKGCYTGQELVARVDSVAATRHAIFGESCSARTSCPPWGPRSSSTERSGGRSPASASRWTCVRRWRSGSCTDRSSPEPPPCCDGPRAAEMSSRRWARCDRCR